MNQKSRRDRLEALVPTYDGGNEYTMIVAGRLLTEDRQVALIWKAAFPDRKLVIMLRFLTRTISSYSKTTYSDWCNRHAIEWRQIKFDGRAN